MKDPCCPTCGAAFRNVAECGRCGTELTLLFSVILRAREARESARKALLEGNGPLALEQAEKSLTLDDTEAGHRLRALALISSGRLLEGVRLVAARVEGCA